VPVRLIWKLDFLWQITNNKKGLRLRLDIY
jgi:hypothetical protein